LDNGCPYPLVFIVLKTVKDNAFLNHLHTLQNNCSDRACPCQAAAAGGHRSTKSFVLQKTSGCAKAFPRGQCQQLKLYRFDGI
jgi:hypothetical protein